MQRFIWEEIISSYCFDETASFLAVTPLFMTHESSKLPTPFASSILCGRNISHQVAKKQRDNSSQSKSRRDLSMVAKGFYRAHLHAVGMAQFSHPLHRIHPRHFPLAQCNRNTSHSIQLIKEILQPELFLLHLFNSCKLSQGIFEEIFSGNITRSISRLPHI